MTQPEITPPSSELESFLSQYSPGVRELALAARRAVLAALPGAVEMVDPPSKIVAYGYGKKYADLICSIAPYSGHVNVIFSRGVDLPDPQGVLEGSGKRARHVKIRRPEDAGSPALQELLQAALRLYRG
ncbi:MAG: DUF1801 domain-containing protein [Chloroflexi bacterium]|nr:DUF1801 domain-containing protein [Chloroflexota bacterium]